METTIHGLEKIQGVNENTLDAISGYKGEMAVIYIFSAPTPTIRLVRPLDKTLGNCWNI
jgi:hypothetical protein